MARKEDVKPTEGFIPNDLTPPDPAPEVIEPVIAQPLTSAIHLLHDYGGRRTNELRIAPGVYRQDDPALFGLAEYLVQNGHAVAL